MKSYPTKFKSFLWKIVQMGTLQKLQNSVQTPLIFWPVYPIHTNSLFLVIFVELPFCHFPPPNTSICGKDSKIQSIFHLNILVFRAAFLRARADWNCTISREKYLKVPLYRLIMGVLVMGSCPRIVHYREYPGYIPILSSIFAKQDVSRYSVSEVTAMQQLRSRTGGRGERQQYKQVTHSNTNLRSLFNT